MENKILGNIHSFESFGTVDGPGVRFVVFMQGCSLACKYCHNRDAWQINAGQKFSADDIVKEILKYKNYIMPNGGVTITGGEPLLQAQFLIEIFTKLKESGIHTAIDTSGMVDITEDIKKLLTLTDLILLDIKHINNEKCKNLVGRSNIQELAFAKYLSDNNIPIWIRQVIVPGITDNEKDLLDLKDFISSLKTVQKVELSPYHEMGKYKWKELGFKYELENVSPATSEDIERAKKILGL